MKKVNVSLLLIAMLVIFSVISCTKNTDKNITKLEEQKVVTNEMIGENGANPDESIVGPLNASARNLTGSNEKNDGGGHFLYTETNNTRTNEILIYKINSDGTLHLNGTTTSGGTGTGAGLGSQGALILDNEHEWLFAVNAGSNSVSSFRVHDDGSLSLAHTESSRGKTPVSLSVHGNLLYVLNTGSDNIHGFRIDEDGRLTHIEGSTQSLSGAGVNAPQISFTPNGNWLIVTEKATNRLVSFKLKNNGAVWPAIVTASAGATPFGFEFARDNFMVVSNAAGGAAGAGSATSYVLGANGKPHQINGAVPDHEAAPCWVAVTRFGRFAFLTNTASNSVSSYYVAPDGSLYLVHQVAASTDGGPVDIVVAKNNFDVFVLNGKAKTIGEYHRTFFGGLSATGSVGGLPAPATGLATY